MFECRRIRKRLVDYLEDALSDSVRADMARHMESCSACRRELEVLQLARRALSSVRRARAPAGIWTRIDARLGDIEGESSWMWRLLSRRPAYACIAWLVLFVLGASTLFISPAGHVPPFVSIMISPLSPVGISVQATA